MTLQQSTTCCATKSRRQQSTTCCATKPRHVSSRPCVVQQNRDTSAVDHVLCNKTATLQQSTTCCATKPRQSKRKGVIRLNAGLPDAEAVRTGPLMPVFKDADFTNTAIRRKSLCPCMVTRSAVVQYDNACPHDPHWPRHATPRGSKGLAPTSLVHPRRHRAISSVRPPEAGNKGTWVRVGLEVKTSVFPAASHGVLCRRNP
jgi:hypothetical protein